MVVSEMPRGPFYNAIEARDTVDRLYGIIETYQEKYFNVLSRKYRQSLYHDDYGNIKSDPFYGHADYFFENVILNSKECRVLSEGDREYLIANKEFFINIITHAVEQNGPVSPASDITQDLDGEEYERIVGHLFTELGWKISFTPRTGDQGVDLVAERGRRRVAVQCKRYIGSVGNAAVQEVHSGGAFYECNECIVVSSGNFTRAALQLAQSLGVKCLHHEQVQELYT